MVDEKSVIHLRYGGEVIEKAGQFIVIFLLCYFCIGLSFSSSLWPYTIGWVYSSAGTRCPCSEFPCAVFVDGVLFIPVFSMADHKNHSDIT